MLSVGDGTETCLKICENQRTLFDRFWTRRRLGYFSVLGSTPGDLYTAGRRRRIEAADELVETE